MPDDVDAGETGEDQDIDQEPTAEELEGQRRAQKDRNKRVQLADENKALRAEKEQRAAKDAEAEKAQLRAKGEFEKIEAQYQAKIRDGQEKLDEAQARIEGFGKAGRQVKFLDKVMEIGGITNRSVAKAMLPTLDIDDAPEAFTEKDAKIVVKLLRNAAPEIFGSGSTEPKPPPGSGKRPPEQGSPEHWKEVGRQFTDSTTNSPYAIATGRSQKA